MVAKIISGNRGMLQYNENKVSESKAQLLLASGFAADVTQMSLHSPGQNKRKSKDKELFKIGEWIFNYGRSGRLSVTCAVNRSTVVRRLNAA